MAKIDTLFINQNGWKTIPFGAAHTYIAHIRESPPPAILETRKTDYHCKINEILFIHELKPALNVNVGSEKLLLYQQNVFIVVWQFHITILQIISV